MGFSGMRELVVRNEQSWGTNTIKRIEKVLDRTLTDDEVAHALVYTFGYYDGSSKATSSFVDDLNLKRVLPPEDVESLANHEEEEFY